MYACVCLCVRVCSSARPAWLDGITSGLVNYLSGQGLPLQAIKKEERTMEGGEGEDEDGAEEDKRRKKEKIDKQISECWKGTVGRRA